MKLNPEGNQEKAVEENKIGEHEEEEEEERGVKWAHHYSSLHHLLIVGDGDFSFSLSLANAFGSASNIVATSLDSHDTLLKKYCKAESNLERLKEFGATVLHDVDATKMKFHTDLKVTKFDRIIYNFPHAGFIGKEDNMLVINEHRKLVDGFFKNASHMLRPYGEVHVSHKIEDPFNRWNLEKLALRSSLILVECAKFSIEDYPGYNNKRGDGHRSDQTFPLGECRTFKFRIGDVGKTKRADLMPDIICGGSFAETTASKPSLFEKFRGNNPLPPAVYPHEGGDRPNFLRSIEDPLRNCRPYMIEGVSSSVHHQPTIVIDNVHLERRPSIDDLLRKYRPYMSEAEDPLRKYRPYMSDVPWNTEFQHPNVSSPRMELDLPVKYDLEEEIIMRLRMKTNCIYRS